MYCFGRDHIPMNLSHKRKLFDDLYLKVFGNRMGPEALSFFRNTLWSFLGISISALFLFLINIYAGRVLGPEGYGYYNLIIAITSFAAVFIYSGYDAASIKFISDPKYRINRKYVITQSIRNIILTSTLFIIAISLFSRTLAQTFGAPVNVIVFALVFTPVFALRYILDGIVRSLNLFRYHALAKITESIIVTLAFIGCLAITKGINYQQYIISLMIGYAFIVGSFYNSIHRSIRQEKIHTTKDNEFQKYAHRFFAVSIANILITSSDKFLLAHYLGNKSLGIYSAYIASSVIIVSQLILILNNTLFPTIVKISDKFSIEKRIRKTAILLAIPFLLVICPITYAILLIFGKNYSINWNIILLVGMYSYLQLIASLYVTLAISSKRTFKLSSKLSYLKVPFVFALYSITIFFGLFNITSVLIISIASLFYDIISALISLNYWERHMASPKPIVNRVYDTYLRKKGKEFAKFSQTGKPICYNVDKENSILLYPQGNIAELAFASDFESETILATLSLLAKGSCFIDIGANIGLYSLFASKKVGNEGKIIAFEPSLETFELFNRNITLNDCKNINPVRAALLNKTIGTIKLTAETGKGDAYRFVSEEKQIIDDSSAETVPCTTLDDKLSNLKISGKIDLIKIDVEGAELRVLQGAEKTIRANRDIVIVFENSPELMSRSGYNQEDLFAYLKKLGLKVFSWENKKNQWNTDVKNAAQAAMLWACRDSKFLPPLPIGTHSRLKKTLSVVSKLTYLIK